MKTLPPVRPDPRNSWPRLRSRPAPTALRQLRSKPGEQRVTRSAKGFRAQIPIILIDVDRDGRHHDTLVAAGARDARGRPRLRDIASSATGQPRRRYERAGDLG